MASSGFMDTHTSVLEYGIVLGAVGAGNIRRADAGAAGEHAP